MYTRLSYVGKHLRARGNLAGTWEQPIGLSFLRVTTASLQFTLEDFAIDAKELQVAGTLDLTSETGQELIVDVTVTIALTNNLSSYSLYSDDSHHTSVHTKNNTFSQNQSHCIEAHS